MSINKQLKIGDLTAKLPIIQGGMGVGVSRSSLAAGSSGRQKAELESSRPRRLVMMKKASRQDPAACNRQRNPASTSPEPKELAQRERSCRCEYYGCTEALCGACERGRGSRCRCDHQWRRASDEPAGAGQRESSAERRSRPSFRPEEQRSSYLKMWAHTLRQNRRFPCSRGTESRRASRLLPRAVSMRLDTTWIMMQEIRQIIACKEDV